MTQEEKAKAYDEIIKKANKMHHENCEACQICIEELIPELREESEDERIRKALIDGFTVMKESKNCGKTFSNHNIPVADILTWLEKQGEQKPADKVEPKFHEGEWVVYEFGEETATLQITRIVGKTYVFSDDSTLGVVDEDTLRLWDIAKDAKAGDVLADDYGIYIFDKFDKYDERCFLCIGAYQYSKKVYEDEHMLCSINVRPATKDQREQLKKAMADAGYTFDFEKKESKKIEQKPAWSGEDENRINRLIAYFEDKESFTAEDDIVYANWLKSLRPQSQWKPSDEQMKALKKACNTLDNIGVLIELYEQLKKLR